MPSGSHCSITQGRKYLEAASFVAIWMASGWIFHLDANQYLLLGVPLLALFQLLVPRQPLRTLWVRDANSFRFSGAGVLVASILAIAPAYDLLTGALVKKMWIIALWEASALAGAVAAGFALSHQNAAAARRALPSFVLAAVIGIGFMAVAALARHHSQTLPISKTPFLLKWFLLYFAVSFVLEEVAFRGALDSHVYELRNPAASTSRWRSAIFVSSLWVSGICQSSNFRIPPWLPPPHRASSLFTLWSASRFPFAGGPAAHWCCRPLRTR
jgi:hypothetical protein